MFKRTPKEILSKPEEYIDYVEGLNSVKDLVKYLAALQKVDTSVECFYITKKLEFQHYIDKAFQSVMVSDKKIIKEKTGDADFIINRKRQELYKKITESGVEMKFLMDIQPWTIKNAKLLDAVGVEVMHIITPEHYHFATWADTMMFTLFGEPVSEKAKKIVSQPQKTKDVIYDFLATNQFDFVKYANRLFGELEKRAISFEDQKIRLNRNKEEDEELGSLYN